MAVQRERAPAPLLPRGEVHLRRKEHGQLEAHVHLEREERRLADLAESLGLGERVVLAGERLLVLARDAAARGPLLLAGSSLGAWISARVSLQVPVAGLFLLAPPVHMQDAGGRQAPPMDAAPVPVSIVHGWHDELIAAEHVVAWARPRNARLLLVDDGHRLSAHVDDSAAAFEALLRSLAG